MVSCYGRRDLSEAGDGRHAVIPSSWFNKVVGRPVLSAFGACADLLEEKKSAPAFLQRRPDAVHVYGVDVLSTDNIMRYFKGAVLRRAKERHQ